MFENIDNLKLISSFHGISKPYNIVKSRKHNTFLFRTSGNAVFKFSDKTLYSNEGEVIFVPQGASYEFKTIHGTECRYTSINFEAELKNATPKVYSLENFSDADYMRNRFPELLKLGTQSDKFKCLSLFYSFLSYISNIDNLEYSDKKKYKIIEPAVEYLRANIFSFSLKADDLHKLCGISDTYFRKIFTSYFGMSPQKYIVSKRISHAKSLLDNGDYDTIAEVSLTVGYKDPLYFSRAFKKKYGISPSAVNK